MAPWIKSLRLPICLLAGLLAIASFKIAGMNPYWLSVLAGIFIACATMLQNDWRDRYHDIRKGKTLALKNERAFLVLLLAFWGISCGLILLVAIEHRNVGAALSLMALVGLIYSETRRIPIVPVMLVALASASPTLLPVMMGASLSRLWAFFLSSALVIFGREITKDLDGEQIDSGYKWTIPLAVGTRLAKIIAVSAMAAGFAVATIGVSVVTLLGSLIALVGVVLLVRGANPRTSRIYLDVGVALAILTLIV